MQERDVNEANRINAFFERYAMAVSAKDVDALLQLYADDVRVFDAWGVWSYEGDRAWRGAVEGWFSSSGSENLRVTFDDVRAIEEGDLWHASAIVTYSAITAAGDVLRALQNRLTWVLRPSPSLRIVHEHTSAPIGVDDMKAMLRRTPAS